MKSEVGAETHRGRRRRRNEDAIIVRELPDAGLLLAVADGMGGAAGGEIASSEAVKRLAEKLDRFRGEHASKALRDAIGEVNKNLREICRLRPELEGMGTTLVAGLVRGRQVWLANVGDSRAYLVKGSRATRVTQDHSLVAEQVRSGHMSEEEARLSDQRNIITRSLGPLPDVEVDTVGPLRLTGGSYVVLCSDGLHGLVDDEEIHDAVVSTRPRQAARRLVALANKRGGVDNISVIVYQAQPDPDDTVVLPHAGGRMRRVAPARWARKIAVLVGSIVAGVWRLLIASQRTPLAVAVGRAGEPPEPDVEEPAGSDSEEASVEKSPADASVDGGLAFGAGLVVRTGPDRGRVFDLGTAAVVIGRSDQCEIPLRDPRRVVSREHARVWWDGSRLWIEDLGSTNGTKVNGRKITRSELEVGDTVEVGLYDLELVECGHGQETTSSESSPEL